MRQQTVHQAWIIAAAALVFFTNLGATALWDEDEPIYATCAREMLQRNDWVVPRFNGTLFPEKPPLMFWTMIAGFKVFGINEFGSRVGSAILGILTALATYHLGRRLFSAKVGLWAGLIIPATFIFTVSARAATVDCALALVTLLSVYCFVLSEAGKIAPLPVGDGAIRDCLRGWFWLALMYACFGVAVLAKGPIGLLLPAAGIGFYVMVVNHLRRIDAKPRTRMRNRGLRGLVWTAGLVNPLNFLRSLWQLRPLTGCVVVLLVAAPWYILVDQRTHGEFTAQFFSMFNLRPFSQPFLGHRGPFWYHLPVLLIGFFPWSVFMGPTLIDWTQRIRQRHPWWPAYLLLACWSAAFFIFWSICKTKLPHYLLPIYPALALATAAFVDHWLAEPAILGRRSVWIAWGITIVVGLGFVGAFPILATLFLPGEGSIGLVGLILTVGGGVSLYLVQHQRRLPGMVVFAATAVLFITAIFGFAALRIDRHQNARALLAKIHADSPGQPTLMAYRFLQKSYVYYAGRPVDYYQDAEALHRRLDSKTGYVFSNERYGEELMRQYPGEFEVLVRQRRFLHAGDVLVLAHRKNSLPECTALRTSQGPERR